MPSSEAMRLIGRIVVSGRWANLISWSLATVAILVPVAFWFVDADKKSIDLRIVSVANLDPSLPDGFQGDVDISLRGYKLRGPQFVVLEVVNAGNESITAADVEKPLVISAGHASIAKVHVMKTHPANLNPDIGILKGKAVLAPLLLNPGDSFQVGVLTSGPAPEISADSRISGVDEVRVTQFEDGKIHVPLVLKYLAAMFLMSTYLALLVPFASAQLQVLRRGAARYEIRRIAPLFMAIFCAGAAIIISADLEPTRWVWEVREMLFMAGYLIGIMVIARVLIVKASASKE